MWRKSLFLCFNYPDCFLKMAWISEFTLNSLFTFTRLNNETWTPNEKLFGNHVESVSIKRNMISYPYKSSRWYYKKFRPAIFDLMLIKNKCRLRGSRWKRKEGRRKCQITTQRFLVEGNFSSNVESYLRQTEMKLTKGLNLGLKVWNILLLVQVCHLIPQHYSQTGLWLPWF